MESVTIDHPKIAFKLSKPTTIAQKLNKIKIYIKSITTDRTLQLDIFKRHIIPKKCSQFYKMKILNSKQYNEQPNFTRSSIENKLFEVAKEFQ